VHLVWSPNWTKNCLPPLTSSTLTTLWGLTTARGCLSSVGTDSGSEGPETTDCVVTLRTAAAASAVDGIDIAGVEGRTEPLLVCESAHTPEANMLREIIDIAPVGTALDNMPDVWFGRRDRASSRRQRPNAGKSRCQHW